MLNPDQIAAAADKLYDAERARIQVPALTQSYNGMDMDDAYAIQTRWVDRKIADGQKVIGYKVGLTSRAMQMVMKINTPDYGVLLDSMAFENGSHIDTARFTDPRIEAEFAFVMKKPLFGEVSVDQVMDATDYVIPALELISARSYRVDPETGYVRNVYDTIADNAANAGIITASEGVKPEDVDLCWSGALVFLNDEVEETGLGGGVMNHPAHGVAWVCRRFAPHGIGLEPGQIILSGSFTRPIIVTPGDRIRADYGALGEISVTFD
jgi:2-oxo-hept-3-ene-1,7-dioate hydratase